MSDIEELNAKIEQLEAVIDAILFLGYTETGAYFPEPTERSYKTIDEFKRRSKTNERHEV